MIEVDGVYYAITNSENIRKLWKIVDKLRKEYEKKFKKSSDDFLNTLDFLPAVDSLASILWYCIENNVSIERGVYLFWHDPEIRKNAKFRLVGENRRYPNWLNSFEVAELELKKKVK